MLRVVDSETEEKAGEIGATLDELAREGARRMLIAALEEEVTAYLEGHSEARDERGHAQVVRNGRARARKVTLGAGTVEIRAPRVNDRRLDEEGRRQRFTSHILPPYMRRSPKVDEALPVLYLRGLSTGDFRPALQVLLGEDASGLSATSISRLTAQWETEYERFRRRPLAKKDYVYIWVDGIHLRVRLGKDRLCLLVVLGVRPDGRKELVAIADGYRESADSWAELLRDLKTRGMRAPCLAVGDGALGFWKAVGDVWPQVREQQDWFHKLGNVLDKLPKRLQPKAKAALHAIMYADSRGEAEEAIETFDRLYRDRHPKAVECLRKDEERLLSFFDFPGRALDPPAHHQRDRVGVCHRAAAPEDHQGTGQSHQGPDDGLQAPRDGPATLAPTQLQPPAAAGASRREVCRRRAARARRCRGRSGRLIREADPQHLTISPAPPPSVVASILM